MKITVSMKRVVDAISQLEGRQIDLEELEERPQRYAGKLREYLSTTYGVLLQGFNDRGNVADYRGILQTSDRKRITAGLSVLNPLSVSFEPSDLQAVAPAMAGAMSTNWTAIQAGLQQLGLDEMWNALEEAAWKLVELGRNSEPSTEAQVGFDQWAVESNLRIPQTASQREQYRLEEARQRQLAEERRFAEKESESRSSWHVRPLPSVD